MNTVPNAAERKAGTHWLGNGQKAPEREKKNMVTMLTNAEHRDAFQKRERASEDYAIRQREKEKLLELKARLAEQKKHLQQLSDHM